MRALVLHKFSVRLYFYQCHFFVAIAPFSICSVAFILGNIWNKIEEMYYLFNAFVLFPSAWKPSVNFNILYKNDLTSVTFIVKLQLIALMREI